MASAFVRFEGITKRFPGVQALRAVSFEVARGACHALCGENGAGKSTLGRILAGIHAPDEGRLVLDGRPVRFSSPRAAAAAGVRMVHQELAFCENLSVAENLCLERLPSRALFVSRQRMRARAAELLAAVGGGVDVERRLGELSVAQQQLVQIAAALGQRARMVVFDEPTSSLSGPEAERLFALLRSLQARGLTALYISHRLDEIFRVAGAVTVLRDGRHVATKRLADVSKDELVQMMIGRRLEEYFPGEAQRKPGAELLRVEGLSSPGKVRDVSFRLRAGEVLGLAGLVGAGRTELAHALFGLDPRVRGKIYVRGRLARIPRPAAALRLGLGLLPEDRKRHGLVLSLGGRANISLPILGEYARAGWINQRAERAACQRHFDLLRIRATHPDAPVAGLSGGNQQKVVLARWLAAQCQILILDEPTRGVDVGAKAEFHGLIEQLAADGCGVVLISSELPEIMRLANRILVLRQGRLVGELPGAQASEQALLRLMAGV